MGVVWGGTNTQAVLFDGRGVVASTQQPTTSDVSSGIAAAIRAVLSESRVEPAMVDAVMIGTTHFTNALVERKHLDRVGIIRLASPSGDALPPLTAWPDDLAQQIGGDIFLLPGGYAVEGREIAPFDERNVGPAAQGCRGQDGQDAWEE